MCRSRRLWCVNSSIRRLKIGLNDASWSSTTARVDGLRRLAVLQLGTRDSFDSENFVKKVALININKILPIALNSAGLSEAAKICADATTLTEGLAAARSSSSAARAAEAAAARAADVARSDRVLKLFATHVEDILIEMNVPAVKYLKLINKQEK